MITRDPLGWSASMVGSWVRLCLYALFFAAFLIYTVVDAAASGWRSSLGSMFFLSILQVQILYALRRLVLRAQGADTAATDPDVERMHFVWLVVVFVVGASVMFFSRYLPRGV